MTNPGVQNPHCRPWQSRNADCTGDSPPSAGPMPSIVVTSVPSACTANIRHDAHRGAVDQHRARAADAVLATEVRPGQPALLAQEVGERRARFDGRAPRLRR